MGKNNIVYFRDDAQLHADKTAEFISIYCYAGAYSSNMLLAFALRLR